MTDDDVMFLAYAMRLDRMTHEVSIMGRARRSLDFAWDDTASVEPAGSITVGDH